MAMLLFNDFLMTHKNDERNKFEIGINNEFCIGLTYSLCFDILIMV